jgi:tRNA G10  N-methylase Trm11
LFPRDMFAHLYQERDVHVRMIAKLRRTYRRPPEGIPVAHVYHADARSLPAPSRIDAIITSPPYMNELDYVRDNRLRLWFISRALPQVRDIPRGDRERLFRDLLRDVFSRLLNRLASGGAFVIVVGDSRRGGHRLDSARVVKQVFSEKMFASLRLVEEFHDRIPDIRRSRRDLSGTKRETILAYRLSK